MIITTGSLPNLNCEVTAWKHKQAHNNIIIASALFSNNDRQLHPSFWYLNWHIWISPGHTTFENVLSLLSRVICADFVACGDTGMRWMDDFGWQWENWGRSTSPLIVQPASPLNEPEHGDDEDCSEKNDDYDFDNHCTGTVKRQC